MAARIKSLVLVLLLALWHASALAVTQVQAADPDTHFAASVEREAAQAEAQAGLAFVASANGMKTLASDAARKLKAGATWTRDEIAKTFTAVDAAISAASKRIGSAS